MALQEEESPHEIDVRLSAPADGAMDPGRDRALRLFEYLRKLVELRARPVLDVADYDEAVWFADIPDEPECRTVGADNWAGIAADQTKWVELDRPVPNPRPDVPDVLLPWVDLDQLTDPYGDPRLREELPLGASDGVPDDPDLPADPADRPPTDPFEQRELQQRETQPLQVSLAERPDVQAAWAAYRAGWELWAAEERRIRPVATVYRRLFEVEQLAAQLGERLETVVGFGLLTLSTSGQVVRRHLLTVPAQVRFDADSGRITVGPSPDGAPVALEEDMLEGGRLPRRETMQAQRERLNASGEPWNREALDAALRTWVHAFDDSGAYDPSGAPGERPADHPVVAFAPAVLLRRRTPRNLLELYDRVREQLADPTVPVPQGIREFVDRASTDERSGTAEQPGGPPGDGGTVDWARAEEVYFPLPSNDAQRSIVDSLAQHRGVVVQGPPGTGKSHTIANLISHLLAQGKRVLVTSHTGRALEVLRAKLPEDVAKLCVSVTGDGRRGAGDLQRSVQALLGRTVDPDWDDRAVTERVAALRERLRGCESERNDLLARHRALREREIQPYELPYGGYRGTLAAIGERLREEQASYGWLPDRPDGPPPLDPPELTELLGLLRTLRGDELARAALAVPEPDQITSPKRVERLLDALAAAEQAAERYEEVTSSPAYTALTVAPPEAVDALTAAVGRLNQAHTNVMRAPEPWVGDAARAVLDGRAGEWRDLLQQSEENLYRLADAPRWADAAAVTGVDDLDPHALRTQAVELAQHLRAGGRIGGVLKAPPVRNARLLLERVRVGGSAPTTPALLDGVIATLDARAGLGMLERLWYGRLPAASPSTSWSTRRARVAEATAVLREVLELARPRADAETAARALPGLAVPRWSDAEQVGELHRHLDALSAGRKADDARTALVDAAGPLRAAAMQSRPAPACALAAAALAERDLTAYTQAVGELDELHQLRVRVARRDELLGGLRTGSAESSGAPELAVRLEADPDDVAWDRRLAELELAWDWARADGWHREQVTAGAEHEVARRLRACEQRILDLTGQIGAHLAWQHCLTRMTREDAENLKAYGASMRKYGKGTGRYAARHLSDAQRYMEACQGAVPAWIMPTWRVAETLTAQPDAFDVVIVDEASQSGVESLFLLWLAGRMVVVGDDRQISPDNVGVPRELVYRYIDQYLHDVPLRSLLDLDTSLFDLAAARYRQSIWLQEHFRCMPEIVEFSNQLSYQDNPLVPVRQFGAERLPPLRAVQVAGANSVPGEQGKINALEAAAIVERIEKCLADPAYDGLSMGVVSLLGEGQAKLIRRMLLERIGPEEMRARRLVCGDAYAFQGDERSVMFLSMVVAPSADGRRLPVLSYRGAQQRFNVAASRARDQLWLFHSVAEADLGPDCVRFRLLEHVRRGPVAPADVDLGEVHPDIHREPFDNLLEQRVYLALRSRGYRVLPKHHLHGLDIDLVVVGEQARLAVEFDGETWRGPERYEHDMARQRDLERCGWRFFRVRASEFARDPDQALESLWTMLRDDDIAPIPVPAQSDPGP